MELHTERLILRPWHEEDAEALFKYASNPNIGPIAGWPPHTSIEESRAIIREVLSGEDTYAVVLRKSGEAVGSIGLMRPHHAVYSAPLSETEGEIGYWIGEPYWGQGLIPEAVRRVLRYAFEERHLSAVWCSYYDGNEKSRRVQEKCGFTYRHSEIARPVPLLSEHRTVHFTRHTHEEWQVLTEG